MTGPSFPERQPVSDMVDSPWGPVVERLRAATIGEYDIGYELGRGGMAAVFLAYDLALARHVAIKVMSPALLMGEGMVERFRQEARTIANLTHPGIITIYAVRQLADLHFFVMRFIEGRSLEHILGVSGGEGLPIGVVKSLLQQVGSALGYAHRKGVVHRDVKPANVLVDVEGTALVTDFGIAKVAASSTHTQTGIVVGTPAYISPEQCMGKPVDGHSDQYSLGVAAYEMLAGKPPFAGQGFTIMLAHVSEVPRPVRELRPDCPPELEAAVMRMLAKNPSDRFATMGEALDAMGELTSAEDEEARAHLATLAKPDETLHRRLSGPQSPVPATRRRSSVASLIIPDLDRGSTLVIGSTVHLNVSAVDANGWIVDRKPEWFSSNERIATVSADGDVTALSPGEVHITARLDAQEAQLALTVAEPVPAPVLRLDEPAVESPAPRVSSLSATMMSGFRAAAQFAKRLSTSQPAIQQETPEAAEIPDAVASTAPAMRAISEPSQVRVSSAVSESALSESAASEAAVADVEAVTEQTSDETRVESTTRSLLSSIDVRRAALWAGGLVAAVILMTVAIKMVNRSPRTDTGSSAGAVAATTKDSALGAGSGPSAATASVATAQTDSTRAADSAAKAPTRAGPAPVATVRVAGPSSLAVGEFAKLQASIRDTSGKIVTRRLVRWKALNADIASVDTFGTIQARSAGKASFVASVDGKTDRFELTVTPRPEAALAGQATGSSPADSAGPSNMSAADRLKRLAGDCIRPLQSMDSEAFDQYYAPLNRDAQRLVQTLATSSSLDMVIDTFRDPKINDKEGTASLEFSGKMSGGRISGSRWGPVDATLVADYQRSGENKWSVKHCRITKLGRL